MRRVWLLFAGLLLLSGMAFAEGEDSGIQIVENPSCGYSITIPAEWEYDLNEFTNSGNLFFSVPYEGVIPTSFNILPILGDYEKVKNNLEKGFLSEFFSEYYQSAEGQKSLQLKVYKKPVCVKVNGIEICSAQFKYSFPADGPQRGYFGVFKTKKGAYFIYYSSDIKTFDKDIENMSKKVFSTLKLIEE